MSDLDITLHRSVRELPEWDTIHPPNGMYMAAWWFERAEEMFADVTVPTYIAVRDGDRVLGAIACWTIPRKGIVFPPVEPSRLFAKWEADGSDVKKTVVTPMPEEQLYPYTIAGTPRGYCGRLLVRPDLDPDRRRRVIREMLDAAERVARDAGSRLVFLPYLPTDEATELLEIGGPKVVGTYGVTDAYLAPVTTLEAQLERFPGKRRGRIKGDIAAFAAAGLRIEVRRLSEVFGRVERMLLDHIGTLGYSVDAARLRDDLAAMASRHDERTRCFCAMRGDEIVGASLFGLHEGVAYTRNFGFDPSVSRQAGVYFNLMFYAPLDHLAADGIRAIHIGGGTLETKIRRGCKVMARWNLVIPLVEWDQPTRELVTACGRTLLETELAIMTPLSSAETLESELGLTAVRRLEALLRPLEKSSS